MATPKKKSEETTDTSYYPESPIETLIATGIPCKRVIFQTTVNSVKGEPEFTYYDGGTQRASRQAKIYYTTAGIVLVQNGRTEIIPLANVKQSTPIL